RPGYRADRGRLPPRDGVVVRAQADALAEVGPAVRREAADGIDAPRLEQVHTGPPRHQPVAHQHVPGTEYVPELPQQADLPLALARVPGEPEVHDPPARQ